MSAVNTFAGRYTRVAAIMLAVAFLACQAQAYTLELNSGESQVTLLELYTSQGCSSCPPAERWLNELVDSDDLWTGIVPVALHVDYWDNLGWKDPYATAENSERQRHHARAGNARTVYTPGFFVNGRDWRGWMLRNAPRASDRKPGELRVRVDNHTLTARFAGTGAPLDLHIVLLGFDLVTRIERGENRNRTLVQEFVALAHEVHTANDGHWVATLPEAAKKAGRYGIALWVSEAGKPAPLQATGGWLPSR